MVELDCSSCFYKSYLYLVKRGVSPRLALDYYHKCIDFWYQDYNVFRSNSLIPNVL